MTMSIVCFIAWINNLLVTFLSVFSDAILPMNNGEVFSTGMVGIGTVGSTHFSSHELIRNVKLRTSVSE